MFSLCTLFLVSIGLWRRQGTNSVFPLRRPPLLVESCRRRLLRDDRCLLAGVKIDLVSFSAGADGRTILQSLSKGLVISSVGNGTRPGKVQAGRQAGPPAETEQLSRLAGELTSFCGRDFGTVLDLAVSSVVVLLRAAAAWGFSWIGRAERASSLCGSGAPVLRSVEKYWYTASGPREHVLAGLARQADRGPGGRRAVHLELSSRLFAVSVGVLDPADRHKADHVLRVLAEPLFAAAEAAALRGALDRRLGALLDSSRCALLAIGPGGRIAVLNPAGAELLRTLGIAAAVGGQFFGAGLGRNFEDGVRRALAGVHGNRRLDLVPDHLLSWTAGPLISDEGRPAGCLLVIKDVTDRAVFQLRAQDWGNLLIVGEVAAGMAHEIRNPLSAALGVLQLLQARASVPEDGRLLARLRAELERINDILSNYLALSHPSGAGRQTPIDVRNPVREALLLVEGEAATHDIELVAEIPEGPFPACTGRPEAVKQVLLNLAKNAIEAMDGEGRFEKGRLEIGLASCGAEVLISVQDTGPGIPHEARAHLFRPFFTTKPHRTGLGLSVTRELVRQMHGTIEVCNSGQGGARAVVRLPAAERESGSAV